MPHTHLDLTVTNALWGSITLHHDWAPRGIGNNAEEENVTQFTNNPVRASLWPFEQSDRTPRNSNSATLHQKATIHQVTTMLATSKKSWGSSIIKVLGHQYRWLAGGYDLEIEHFRSPSMVVTWWIGFFCAVTFPLNTAHYGL